MQTDHGTRMDGRLLGGRYQVKGVLGRGGMAEVYDGWDTRLDRPVAIKLLHPRFRTKPDYRERFHAEARAAAALNHPNIVGVHDLGDDHGTSFIVMERLPGATLADEIAAGPLSETRVHSVLDDILAALSAAHGAGILHRDIKPGNILVAPDGDVVKVADFGIAQTPGAPCPVTGQIVGTMAYVSPERLTGAPAAVADDIYAVGIVGYECLTGNVPFTCEDDLPALARAILLGRPSRLGLIRPDADPGLVTVIERAMSRDPRRRFTDVEAMRVTLSCKRLTMTDTVPFASIGRFAGGQRAFDIGDVESVLAASRRYARVAAPTHAS